jgi:hypothetical protein
MVGPQGMVVSACHFKLHVGTKFPATELGVWRSAISGRSMAEKNPSIDLNIRNRIGESLRSHYRACMDNELSPRLLALIEKLKNEREISAEEIEPIRKAENETES